MSEDVTLWVQIGEPPAPVTSTDIAEELAEFVRITADDVLITTFDPAPGDDAVVFPTDAIVVTDRTDVLTYSEVPTTGSPTPPGEPSAEALLGVGGFALPSGWPARTQVVVNATGSRKEQVTPMEWHRGVLADNATVDFRNQTLWSSSRTQYEHKSAFSLNQRFGDFSQADNTCSRRPAVVGSRSDLAAPTPTSQVGKIAGLHTNSTWDGVLYHAVPEAGPWHRWKGGGRYAPDPDADVQGHPWDGRAMHLEAFPGDPVIVDGMHYQHIMDGPSTRGARLKIRNCLFQYVHDDCFEQDGGYGPVDQFENLYWNCYMGISYDTGANGGPGADRHLEQFYVDNCVFFYSRELVWDTPVTTYSYDSHAHGAPFKNVGRVANENGTNAPQPQYHNTTILMLGQPGEGGLGMLGLPFGSNAYNSTFIYVDMGHNTGDAPPSWPKGDSRYVRGGREAISYYDAGFDVRVAHTMSDPVVTDRFWPAVQSWIAKHPQYGKSATVASLNAL